MFDPQQVGAMDSFPVSAMFQDFLQHLRFCGKSVALTWQADDDINISLIKMPQGDPNSIATPVTQCLFNGEEVILRDFDFCPAVGRLVPVTTAAAPVFLCVIVGNEGGDVFIDAALLQDPIKFILDSNIKLGSQTDKVSSLAKTDVKGREKSTAGPMYNHGASSQLWQ